MQSTFAQFVITRIGLGIYDSTRLNKMVDLFAAVTLPSIQKQTKQEFVWLIVVDAACPVDIKNRILSLITGHQNYYCVSIDLTSIMNVHLACFDWVWDRCQNFILEHGLIDHPEQYIGTSIIDADDAWNCETIAMIDQLVATHMPAAFAKKDRGTWLRHSTGLTITFYNGYVWFISARKVYPLKSEFRSMSVFVVARFSSGISACSCRHTQWRKYSEILDFEVLSFPSKDPMWIYARHDEAVESWNAGLGMPMPASFGNKLQTMFGIDCDKVDLWLRDYPPREQTEKQFNPAAALRYDLMFKIAARNRQILALGGEAAAPDRSRSNALLSEAVAEREQLILELRSAGAGE